MDSKILRDADKNYKEKRLFDNQTGRLGVDLAQASQSLRNQERLTQTANKRILGRNCVEFGGVWVDDQFNDKTKTVTVKAQSAAYFRLLEQQPTLKDVFRVGNHLVWIAPSGTALIIDADAGLETIEDGAIAALFAKS